ncbi:MAG TPA: CoA transferase [Polyangiaceae bacterium]
MSEQEEERCIERSWADLGGDVQALARLRLSGAFGGLPSVYPVATLATACVGLATLAVADVLGSRCDRRPAEVNIDRRHAAVAFRSERYLQPIGWELPPAWDPIAGDYETSDGFIRLHTNYEHHRAAVLRVLGTTPERDILKQAVRAWSADELETAVVGEGGAAAAMRSAAEFAAHAQGQALAEEPLFAVRTRRGEPLALRPSELPLSGVRVLDLTRVIAGPVCTRFLAAYGADVLRIDPPGFHEVGALLAETTMGKRRAFLDLRKDEDRTAFQSLVAGAHVLVHGYRSDALERLGFDESWRARTNPNLVSVSLDAYGFTGPWAARRGFDSLVQMSTGIAAKGRQVTGAERPVPLPAQALDHGTGYLMAAAVSRALARRAASGDISEVRLSLARTARLLMDLGEDDPRAPELSADDVAPCLEEAETAWGKVQRVRCPGSIDGMRPRWSIPAGPLGSDPPVW